MNAHALLILPPLAALACCIPPADAALPLHRDCLVGVYYFSGWWRPLPNKWVVAGRDWRADFPGRVPLLGQYNEQAAMDREILAASDHGVAFFQILWYYQDPNHEREPHQDKLNEGLRLFMASRYANRMRFTVEYVNHPPFDITTDAAWEVACREWIAAMKHPSYLRVGGEPVFKIHGLDYFLQQNGGDVGRAEARLNTLRRLAKEAGLPPLLIGAGVGVGAVASSPAIQLFDFLTTYMDVPPVPPRQQPYPYTMLIDHAEDGWRRYAANRSKPYVPYVPAGWDPRPWRDPRASFMLPTMDQWLDALRRAKAALDSSPNLGVPLPNGGRQKMLLIYAWNEFGEGGIVAPTKGDGYAKLDAIKAVFR